MLSILNAHLIAVAAGANEDTAVVVPFKARVIAAYFAPIAAVTANDTDYATLALTSNDGAGGSFAAIASSLVTTTAGTGNMAVGTSEPFALSATGKVIPAGGQIKLAKTYAGNGVAVEGVLTVLVEKVA